MTQAFLWPLLRQLPCEKFVQLCRDKGLHVETGEFGAYMQVESLNDGPVTLIVDTDNL